MTSALASDLFRAALWTAIKVGGPMLAVLTTFAVVFGVLQAATQVQDSSVSFTPKVAAAAATIWLGSTWMCSSLASFMHKTLVTIPWIVQR